MWKYISNANNTRKVFFDKATDYISYYTGYDEKISDDENDDTIKDYDGVLKIELYQDENEHMRIYPTSTYYNEYSTFWGGPTHVVDNIYLGSAYDAADYESLKANNIKIIMNATKEISNYYPEEFKYYRYKLYDNNKHSIKKYLEQSFKDIMENRETTPGNILIHCFMGASRSASIVIYYLMRTMKHDDGKPYTFDDAVTFLKDKRIIVNPTFRLTKDLASSMYPGVKN
ncbi:dual specificity phosphatase [Fadolivirus algeromassiliense]|jgi:hypothetical protein|uniref:Dual specificity phosphatase n=1 Tax=Fadolivirus FV1/VV64 TaxID=3070911 RepID=A0A7D3QVL1_9VIRU|nr:dual specificity phosphatase [Fadolivirus algeromassiliense]QKF93639.1 dual specificity phosphatase [Fadolivirus FV1/VV64]